MKRLLFLAGLLLTAPVSASTLSFSTDYTYVDPTITNSCWPAGTYTVASSADPCHRLWTTAGDLTTDDDDTMLLFNGYDDSDQRTVWSHTFQVGAGSYQFQLWGMNLCCGEGVVDGPQLSIYLNDVLVGQGTTDGVGVWVPVFTALNFSVAQAATLTIRNTNPAYNGNDFALDGIDLQPVPEPFSLLLLGTGLAMAGKRLRKRNV